MISIDMDDIFAGKFYPNGFLWEDGKVDERNWWVPKNWKNEKQKS